MPTIVRGKTVAIVNPQACSGAAERRWELVREALEVHFPGLESRYTEGPNHAGELAREALEAGAETIVSFGGDGTANEVLCGFVDERGDNLFPDACLAILAAGTGGDFQRMFGRVKVQRQIDRMCAAEPRLVDYGFAHYTGPDGRIGARPFLNIASIGVSGDVVRRVNGSEAKLGATMKYLMGSLQGIAHWRNVQVLVRYDDELDRPLGSGAGDEDRGRRIDLTLAIVANGQYFGAGMWVCPFAAIDDGRFDCLEVTGMSRTKLTATLAKVFRGNHMRTRGIELRHTTRVGFDPVWAEADVPIEIDGEQVGRLPARFELKRGALKIRIQ
ncbi:MAG: diacylglycerol kinase family protein [Enhygromyxa sp.]